MVIIITFSVFAQSPQKMSYQCVVRNASGVLVTNQSVGIRISILQGTTTGTVVYQEIYHPNPQTNANGLVSIEIGSGLVITGTFSDINWASGPYFLKTETDPTGATNYTIVGTSQLLSVPYALYAENAATLREVADEFTATTAQTGFTLTQTPFMNSKVKMYINGIRISNSAYNNSGMTLTYFPANNGSYALVAGDRIQFDYSY